MRILIAYDGSDSANAALDDLPRAGLPDEAEALILVTPVWLASSPAEFSRAISWRRMRAAEGSSFTPALREEEEERAISREVSRRLRAHFPGWGVRAQAAEGAATAASQLLRRAVSWGPDLIVIGSEGRSWREPSCGAAPSAVIAGAPCAVRVARPSAGARVGPVRLLVGDDAAGEPGSAIRAVASREWPAGSECRIIRPGQIQQSAVEALREAGLRVSAADAAGGGQRALVEEAERWGADCIFVGSGGPDAGSDPDGLSGLVAPLLASSPCSFEVARTSPRPTVGEFMPGARAAMSFTAAGAAG